jgi:MFS family permease
MKLNRNIALFYIVRALFLPFFWLPVLYFYLTGVKGLTEAQTWFLLSLQELALIFLEIPTGVVADKVSRKFSVSLGYVLTSLPFVFLPLVDSFRVITMLFFIKAIGKALISGADSSLLYDTLTDLGKSSEYKTIMNKSKSMMLIVAAGCIGLGGAIYKYNPNLTVILPFPLMLIGAAAAMLMTEPECSKRAKTLQEANYLKHSWRAFRYILGSRNLWLLTVVFSINEGLAVNMKWFYAPIMDRFGWDLTLIGGVTAGLYVLKSITAGISGKMLEKYNMSIWTGMLVIAFGWILLALIQNSWLLIVGLFIVIFGNETNDPLIEEEIHGNLEAHNRATVASMINLFSSIGATIMLNSFGWLKASGGIGYSLIGLVVLFVTAAGVDIGRKLLNISNNI